MDELHVRINHPTRQCRLPTAAPRALAGSGAAQRTDAESRYCTKGQYPRPWLVVIPVANKDIRPGRLEHEAFQQLILQNVRPLFQAQLSLAKGTSHVYRVTIA